MASHLLFLLFLHFPFETIGTDMMMYRLNHLTPSHTRWLRDFLLPYLHDLTIYMFIDSAWAVQFEQPTLFPPVSIERAHTAYMPRTSVAVDLLSLYYRQLRVRASDTLWIEKYRVDIGAVVIISPLNSWYSSSSGWGGTAGLCHVTEPNQSTDRRCISSLVTSLSLRPT